MPELRVGFSEPNSEALQEDSQQRTLQNEQLELLTKRPSSRMFRALGGWPWDFPQKCSHNRGRTSSLLAHQDPSGTWEGCRSPPPSPLLSEIQDSPQKQMHSVLVFAATMGARRSILEAFHALLDEFVLFWTSYPYFVLALEGRLEGDWSV